jgi:hypothetical protein
VKLDQRATEDLAQMELWSQDSLGYAREHGQRKLISLLEAVRVEIKLEDALLAIGGAPRLRTRSLLWESEGHA